MDATCPSEQAIADLLEHRLDEAERRETVRHLDACDDCRRLVADAGWTEERATSLGRGTAIGRYVVERPLGAGAMGTVYAAHDPELGRDVVVKVLREHLAGETARVAMLREARALARIAHPNVISVHDAGVYGERVYIVMELVEGGTLRDWLATRRAWPAIRDLFVQAALGLEAAHAAGLVHRDFKPDNVLVGRDGRVRVTDFGLARQAGGGPTGSLAGTPAYMSPEQRAGDAADERSDLFSFCVTLYEAIYGERPFPSYDIDATAPGIAVTARTLPAAVVPPHPGMPPRARRALERGLRASRYERPATMRELIAAIEHRPVVTRGRAVAAGALAIGAIGAVAYARSGSAAPVCDGAEAAWGDIWTPEHAERVRAAFAATSIAHPDEHFAEASAMMTLYGEIWRGLHQDACLANVRGEQSQAVLDRRMACLAVRREAAKDLAKTLLDAPHFDFLVEEGASMIRQLPPLDDCREARADDQVSTQHRPLHPPSVTLGAGGKLALFALDGAGRGWRIAETSTGEIPTWANWAPLAEAPGLHALTATHGENGTLSAFALDHNDALVNTFEWLGTGWRDSGWSRVDPAPTSQFVVVADRTELHHLFAVRADGIYHLEQVSPNSGWKDWVRIADEKPQQIAAVVDAHDRPRVFALVDGRVWMYAGGERVPIGDATHALRSIDAAIGKEGLVELVALDERRRAYALSELAGGWGAWEPLGTAEELRVLRLIGRPFVMAFGITADGRFIHLGKPRRWNKWWEAIALDANMHGIADFTLAHDAEGRSFVFAESGNGDIWMRWSRGGNWHGWLLL